MNDSLAESLQNVGSLPPTGDAASSTDPPAAPFRKSLWPTGSRDSERLPFLWATEPEQGPRRLTPR